MAHLVPPDQLMGEKRQERRNPEVNRQRGRESENEIEILEIDRDREKSHETGPRIGTVIGVANEI